MIFRSVSISTSLPPSLSPLHLALPISSSVFPKCSISRARPRLFSHTPPLSNNTPTPTHYEVLKLPPHASHAELKRQFYILSKETHPDVNRHDPEASKRFSQISESYSVLADPEKRKRYDRDVMRHRHQHSRQGHGSHHGPPRGGTYAGHRPASGLSKRRSVFKGPPPSFYAHGNPSPNTQSQAHARASQTQHHHKGGTFDSSAYSEEGPAFNPTPTYRTQTHEDYRRANRRAAELAAAQAEVEHDNFWARFIVVSGVIVLGVTIGTIIIEMAKAPHGGGLTRGDGSRRGERRNDWTKG